MHTDETSARPYLRLIIAEAFHHEVNKGQKDCRGQRLRHAQEGENDEVALHVAARPDRISFRSHSARSSLSRPPGKDATERGASGSISDSRQELKTGNAGGHTGHIRRKFVMAAPPPFLVFSTS